MKPTSLDKWRYSIYTLLIAFLLFNPYLYQITNKIFSFKSLNGETPFFVQCLHGIVFLMIIRYMMDLQL